MSEGSKFPFLPFADAAGRAAYFEAAYLKQLEVTKALENGNAKVSHGSGRIVLLRAE
jgi:hypothetical protein